MKRNVFFAGLVFMLALAGCASAGKPAKAADFEFEIQGTGASRTITITGYKGTAARFAIPDKINEITVTAIGNGSFAYCKTLASVTIPSSITKVGDGAFFECTRLTSVTIPASITEIGNNAFAGCSQLTSITIPPSVAKIGYGAFFECGRLTSVTISRWTEAEEGSFPSNARIIYSD